MRELHQPLADIERWTLPKLFAMANMAAAMSGRDIKF